MLSPADIIRACSLASLALFLGWGLALWLVPLECEEEEQPEVKVHFWE